jgi:cytochrome c biogenesis protein CcdA
MEQTITARIGQRIEKNETRGREHACKASLRNYQLAHDCLKRAERDLAETVAFIATSLTTATALQAVITVANDKLGLSLDVLRFAFKSYIGIFILILLLGFVRASSAMRRRARAEREIDQTKKALFEFCPMDQWPQTGE